MDRSDPRYIAAVKEVRDDPRSRYCFVSGREISQGGGDPHHILPVSLFPELAYESINIVIVHRIAHNILTEGKASELAKLPRIDNLLARMRQLDKIEYEYLKSRIDGQTS